MILGKPTEQRVRSQTRLGSTLFFYYQVRGKSQSPEDVERRAEVLADAGTCGIPLANCGTGSLAHSIGGIVTRYSGHAPQDIPRLLLTTQNDGQSILAAANDNDL